MERIIKCPICGAPIKNIYYAEAFALVEESEYCPRCGYCYEFSYGNYYEYVKRKEFYWSYRTKNDNPIFKHIEKAEWQAKSNWRKYKKVMY